MPSSPSKSLLKRSRESALMPPPPVVKRIKRPSTVLDEDVYAEALGRIIARDFFPGIEEAKSQLGLLEALESRDREWIEDAGRRVANSRTPVGQRPKQRFSTPSRTMRTPLSAGNGTPNPNFDNFPDALKTSDDVDVDIDMSLDAFVAKYTSEDNESFYKIMDKLNQKKANKYAWLRSGQNKIAAPRQVAYRERQRKLLDDKSRETASNDGMALLKIENADKRPAMPDTWTAKPNNNLMFAPDGVEDDVETVQQRAEAASKAGPKTVIHSNTRIQPQESTAASNRPPSPSLSAVRDAIAGQPRRAASESIIGSGGETPRVNGYSFVDPSPSPLPEPEDQTLKRPSLHPLLSASSEPSPFKLGQVSKREKLHNRMVDKINRSQRQDADGRRRTKLPSLSPAPRFMSSPRVAAGLSPAGRKLLDRVGTPRAARGGSKLENSVFDVDPRQDGAKGVRAKKTDER